MEQVNEAGASRTWRVILLEALAGVIGGVALGVLGGFAGPWLTDTLGIGQGGDPLLASLFGVFIGSLLGIGLGVTLAGRALRQQGNIWLAWLGGLVGALLGYALVTLVPSLTQSALSVWAAIGGGTLILVVVGYNWRR